MQRYCHMQSSTMDDRENNSLEGTVGALLESRSQAFKKAQANITKAQKQQSYVFALSILLFQQAS